MRIRALIACLALGAAALARADETPKALQPPVGEPSRVAGLPALTVHPGGVILDVKEVGAYIRAHNLPRNLGAAKDVKVLSVERLAVAEARERVGIDTTGFKDDEPVGLALLGGTLVFGGPPPSQPVTFAHGYAVFDALTGNLLMLGTLPD